MKPISHFPTVFAFLVFLTSALAFVVLTWFGSPSEHTAGVLILTAIPRTVELLAFAGIGIVLLGGVLGALRLRFRPAIDALCTLVLCVPLVFGVMAWPSAGAVFVLALFFGVQAAPIFSEGFFRSKRSIGWALATLVRRDGQVLIAATTIVSSTMAWKDVGYEFRSGIALGNTDRMTAALLFFAAAIALTQLVPRPLPVSDHVSPSVPAKTVAITTMGFLATTAILAPVLPIADPNVIDNLHWNGYPLAPGVAGHPLGTDENGRDILARTIYGLRTSLLVAAIATAVASVIVVLAGRIRGTGVTPNPARSPLQSTVFIPIVLATISGLAMRFGVQAIGTPVIIGVLIGAVVWVTERGPMRFSLIAGIGAASLMLEFTLSISGFGIQPPTASLGNMLVNMDANFSIAPWIVIAPITTLIVIILALTPLSMRNASPRAHPSTSSG